MPQFLAKFIVGFLSNKSGDLFAVRLGVSLLLAEWGLVGPVADIVSWFFRGIIGVFMDQGIFLIDLSLDSLKEGMKIEVFKKRAQDEYDKAMKRKYTEAEKDEIRKEYLKTLDDFTKLGGVPDTP